MTNYDKHFSRFIYLRYFNYYGISGTKNFVVVGSISDRKNEFRYRRLRVREISRKYIPTRDSRNCINSKNLFSNFKNCFLMIFVSLRPISV